MLFLASGRCPTSSHKTHQRDIYRVTFILKKTGAKTPSRECIAVAPGAWTHHKTSHLQSSNRAEAQTARQGSVRHPDLGLNIRPPEEANVILGHCRHVLVQVITAVAHDVPKDKSCPTSSGSGAVDAHSQWYQIIAPHAIGGIFTITCFILSSGELSAHAPNKTCAICQQLIQFI